MRIGAFVDRQSWAMGVLQGLCNEAHRRRFAGAHDALDDD
jgi:hypothetical protein